MTALNPLSLKEKTERIAWNFDKLAAALQTAKGRVEFLEDLQNTLHREKGNIEQHSKERAPDNLDDDTTIGCTSALLEGQANMMRSDKSSLAGTERNLGTKTETANDGGSTMGGRRTSF